jgi:predicted ATP-grasp superfamily ATP-dependent carboligase
VAIAEWASTRRCIDKALTHEAAESAGVAVPRTFIPTAEHHLEEIASKIDFDTTDWILKPRWKNIDLDGRYGGFSRHVFKHRKAKSVYSKESMIALLLQAYLDTGVFPLIQERIPGGADCLVGVMAVADENLEPIAICPSRKIRQDPTDFGDGSYAETVDDRELVELMARLIKITRCYGFVLAEFKKDPRDGVFRLIEINPRASSRLSLPRAAGVDLSRVLFDTFAGSNNGRIAEFRAGIRWMHPRRELSLMVRERKPGRVLELLRHLGRTKGFAYSLRDPLPFLIDLVPAAAAAVTGRYGTG